MNRKLAFVFGEREPLPGLSAPPSNRTTTMLTMARPATQPSANADPLDRARRVPSTRTIATIGTGLIAIAIAAGRKSTMTLVNTGRRSTTAPFGSDLSIYTRPRSVWLFDSIFPFVLSSRLAMGVKVPVCSGPANHPILSLVSVRSRRATGFSACRSWCASLNPNSEVEWTFRRVAWATQFNFGDRDYNDLLLR